MFDNADGTYQTTYSVALSGFATANVYLGLNGGFYVEYFNNAFLDGVPVMTGIDNVISYDWGTGMITPQAADFVSIRWIGFILPPTTE